MTGSTRTAAGAAGATVAEKVALDLLGRVERRALDEAKRLLAPGFKMVFPGPALYSGLDEMVAGAAGRYQRVAKLVDEVESFERGGGGGETIVYVRGTLYGVNAHGVEFSGVRFIDRFAIVGDLIASQDVWNDLAESGVLARRP